MIKHTAALVVTTGRKAHMQWLGINLHSAQRSLRGLPRSSKGLSVLCVMQAVRNRDTAWGMLSVQVRKRRAAAEEKTCGTA